MKYIVFLLLFSTLAFAENPKVYSSLGDEIYDNVENIVKLKEMREFKSDSREITRYRSDVLKIKQIGFDLENDKSSMDKSEYLATLRALSAKSDVYVNKTNVLLRKSIQNENSKEFNALLGTGLIDLTKNKIDILNYYKAHKTELVKSSAIEKLIAQERELKKSRAKARAKSSKNSVEKKRVQRIRASDKRKREALERELQEENDKKKLEIRNDHRRELQI